MGEKTIFDDKLSITPLISATHALREALKSAQTQLERDGAIQRFEFTYELLWKTLKKILAFKGIDVNNLRDTFCEAAKNKLIEHPKFWFTVIRKRNLSTHIYNQEMADEIFEFLPEFERELSNILIAIEKL
jgi:nucleotidyltransferase substrate binding protein (TIGR01987 family)